MDHFGYLYLISFFCYVVLFVHCQPCDSLRGNFGPLGSLCGVFLCFITFPYGVLGQAWQLNVSIPAFLSTLNIHAVLQEPSSRAHTKSGSFIQSKASNLFHLMKNNCTCPDNYINIIIPDNYINIIIENVSYCQLQLCFLVSMNTNYFTNIKRSTQ